MLGRKPKIYTVQDFFVRPLLVHVEVCNLISITALTSKGVICPKSDITYMSQKIFFKLIYLFIHLVLEKWEGREKERQRNISVWLFLMCPHPGTW